MKRMKILIALLLVSLAVACQTKPENTFTVPMYFNAPAYFPAGFYLGSDGILHTTWPTGGSMVYPSAGIPLSTGTAWGTSITNNSLLWNTAGNWVNTNGATVLGWGPHAGLYKLLAAKVDYVTEIINKPAEIELAAAIIQVPVLFEILTQTQINALSPAKGKVIINSTSNCLQWYDGTKWRIFAMTN